MVHRYHPYAFEPFEITFKIPNETLPYTWRLDHEKLAARHYNRRGRDRRFLTEPLSYPIQTPEPGSHLEAPLPGPTRDPYLCFEHFRIEGTHHPNPVRLFYRMVDGCKYELHSCVISPRALLQLIAYKAARRYSRRPKSVVQNTLVFDLETLSLDISSG